MANNRNDQARSKAEALFNKKQRAGDRAKEQQKEDAAAYTEKSAKLKAQRLARDAEVAAKKKSG